MYLFTYASSDSDANELFSEIHLGRRAFRLKNMQSIKMIKLILVDFDVNNKKFTFKICTHVVYMYVQCSCHVKIVVSFFEKTFEIRGGGQIDPPRPPSDFKHLKTSPVIGLNGHLKSYMSFSSLV